MISAQTIQRYAADPAAFRADLLVDVDGVVRRFGDVQDPWQRHDFAALDAAWLHCAGRTTAADYYRAYLERGRGHSKTTDLAIMACWTLAFATRAIRGYCFAADKDQAGLLKDAMSTLIQLNPWLGKILDVQRNLILNTAQNHPGANSRLEIFTSDVGSSYGILPDFIIADELCHWQGDGALWHSIISSAAKRGNCVLVVISNAGFIDSWQWNVREAARTDEGWIFSRLDGPQASWLTPARLEEQRRLLPPIAYERLWGNNWSTGGGDALTAEDIDAAFKPDLAPMPQRLSGWDYVAGLDLGVSRDCSSICVLAVRRAAYWEKQIAEHGRIRLAYTRTWKPPRGGKVDLAAIERELVAIDGRYRFRVVNYDPWQATHMSQRLVLNRLKMVEVPPTGRNLQQMATVVIEAFNDQRVDLYPCAELKRDLRRMRIEERSYGFRLVSPRDEHGHGDTGNAFALALMAASETAGTMKRLVGTNLFGRPTGLDERQIAYQREMAFLQAGSSDDTREKFERVFMKRA